MLVQSSGWGVLETDSPVRGEAVRAALILGRGVFVALELHMNKSSNLSSHRQAS